MSTHRTMRSYTCKACGNDVAPNKAGSDFVCTGCGVTIIDSSMVNEDVFEVNGICPWCGGALRRHRSSEIIVCPYCDHTYVLHNPFKQIDTRYDKIIPFTNSDGKETIKRFFTASDVDFAPPDFRKTAKIRDVQHVFIPMYAFDVVCDIRYSLEIGHSETERIYNREKRVYENKSRTIWTQESGIFDSSYLIVTTGLNLDTVVLPDSSALSSTANRSTLKKFCKSLIKKGNILSGTKAYSPLLLGKNSVLPMIAANDAWKQEGAKEVKAEIDRAIRNRYLGQIRNLHWNGNVSKNRTESILYPVSFVSYDYKNTEDQLILLDEVDKQFYCGNFPNSFKKNILHSAKWFFSLCIAAISIFLYAQGTFSHTDAGILVPILGVLFAVVLWLWMNNIKGTGGNRNSEGAKINRKNNRSLGLLSGIMCVVFSACVIACYNQNPAYEAGEHDENVHYAGAMTTISSNTITPTTTYSPAPYDSPLAQTVSSYEVPARQHFSLSTFILEYNIALRGTVTTPFVNTNVSDREYISAAKTIIGKSLKNPYTAHYNSESVYAKDDYGRAIVYLDISAENSFGGWVRSHYYVCIQRVNSDDTFTYNPMFAYIDDKSQYDLFLMMNDFGKDPADDELDGLLLNPENFINEGSIQISSSRSIDCYKAIMNHGFLYVHVDSNTGAIMSLDFAIKSADTATNCKKAIATAFAIVTGTEVHMAENHIEKVFSIKHFSPTDTPTYYKNGYVYDCGYTMSYIHIATTEVSEKDYASGVYWSPNNEEAFYEGTKEFYVDHEVATTDDVVITNVPYVPEITDKSYNGVGIAVSTDAQEKNEVAIVTKPVNAKGSTVRMRKKPEGEVVMNIPFGSKVTVLDNQGDWMQISLDDQIGWMKSEFLSIIEPSAGWLSFDVTGDWYEWYTVENLLIAENREEPANSRFGIDRFFTEDLLVPSDGRVRSIRQNSQGQYIFDNWTNSEVFIAGNDELGVNDGYGDDSVQIASLYFTDADTMWYYGSNEYVAVYKRTKPSAAATSDTQYNPYDSVISRYTTALLNEDFWDHYSEAELNLFAIQDWFSYGGTLQYAIHDVNHDGYNELLIANDSDGYFSIIDIYTTDGTKAVRLFGERSFGYRDNIDILTDGCLYTHGSSSADNIAFEVYSFNHTGFLEKIQSIDYSGQDMTVIDNMSVAYARMIVNIKNEYNWENMITN